MHRIRHQLHDRRWLAVALVVATLILKILIPNGFMPMVSAHGIEIEICTGFVTQPMDMTAGTTTHRHGGHHQDKPAEPCPFAALAMPGLAGADPIQISLVVLYILTTGFLALVRPTLSEAARLRPPLRGPPLTA